MRRTLLATVAATLVAGCGGSDGEPPTDSDTPTAGATPTQPGPDTPTCDPEDVTRPPVATGTNIEGRPYPRKPSPLTDQSILEYLDAFETAFAWNRVLETPSTVTSLNIDNLDGFQPSETGDGFLASSGIRVTYSTDEGDTSERTYVANYFVTPQLVYRYESASTPATPEPADEATQLVQCGTDEDK